jgi:hypothetical protein
MRNPKENPLVLVEGAYADSSIGRENLNKETMHPKIPRNVSGVLEHNSFDLKATSNENHIQMIGPIKVKNFTQPSNICESHNSI